MSDVSEELEALRAIYCNEGELSIDENALDTESGRIMVRILIAAETEAMSPTGDIILSMVINKEYPKQVPIVSLSSQFVSRKNCDILKSELLQYAETQQGNPMLMDLIIWTQENWMRYQKQSSVSALVKPDEEIFWTLLHLDHMRSKAKYTKTIQKWTKELNLCGRLMFCDKLILILLHGSENSIKEYLHLQRTVNVDVDSKGRNCKERMLSQVTPPQPLEYQMHQFEDFQVLDVALRNDLKQSFESFGLLSTFTEHIQTLSR